MRGLLTALVVVGVLMMVGCGGGGPKSTPSPTAGPTGTAQIATADPSSAVKAADYEPPGALPCSRMADDQVVTITLFPDIPGPRCALVSVTQRLAFTNRTPDEVTVRLGRFEVAIPPDETRLLDAPAGTYLALGGHVVSVSGPPHAAALEVIDAAP